MTQASQWLQHEDFETRSAQPSKRLSFLKFLVRYPIILLAFGPPIFRESSANPGLDSSQAHFDIWNVLQVGLLCLIAARAIVRLGVVRSVLIPKQVQSVLKWALFLGLLFLLSLVYSPGRVITAEFTVLYFLTWICVVEFIVDAYLNPPNWMQCLFALRRIAIVLLALVVLCLPVNPGFVMNVVPGAGIRLMGGSVAAMGIICPLIAIISAYSFLYSLESRVRSTVLFLVSIAGLAVTQVRGAELSLILVLAVLGMGWAKASKRSTYVFISVSIAFILLAGVAVTAIGAGRIWNTFNRGQDTEGILSASGRTGVWADVIRYTVDHPQGMGYIAGIRANRISTNSDTSMHVVLNRIGGTDNAYMQTLADAGWLSLALYLVLLAKIAALGWRFAFKRASSASLPNSVPRHALRCALCLFLLCLVEAMESSGFVLPLRQEFYFQNIIIAIILGASTSMMIANPVSARSLGRETSWRRSSWPIV
jgi:O-antigen ligase